MDFGDKGGVILALFGAPLSYENNLIRALNTITHLQRQFKDQIRAGISTGIAYCGLVGSKRRCEYTALGDIVNQSARMMMQAPWGEVWISETISKQITRHYLVEDIGEKTFKGKREKNTSTHCKTKPKTTKTAFSPGK